MKTSGVGVPKKTVWHSAKSTLNASVTRSHWAGPMNSRFTHCSSGRSRLCAWNCCVVVVSIFRANQLTDGNLCKMMYLLL